MPLRRCSSKTRSCNADRFRRPMGPRREPVMTARPAFTAQGAAIPAVGFGTSPMTGGMSPETVLAALAAGYRHIDTARKYGTERAVGEAMRASRLPRGDIFLTTKVSHENLRAADFVRSVDERLAALGDDYVDLLLVHWPNPAIPVP